MRDVLLASLVLLAACGGSSTEDDAASTDSGESTTTSGGTSEGPPSGTATLSGGSAFEVKSAYFRWGYAADKSPKTEDATISLADVAATCAEFEKGLNLLYPTVRIFGLNPRVTGGALEAGEYDKNEDPFASGAHYIGYISVAQGEPGLPDIQGLHATLTDVTNDAIAGSFTVTWADGSASLTGTFSVPLCGPSP